MLRSKCTVEVGGVRGRRSVEIMAVTTIQADVSQSVFELLHSELVGYFQRNHLKVDEELEEPAQAEVVRKLENLGNRIGESLVERVSRDTPRFKNELDAVVFICKSFWLYLFNKQIDNLKTNHQDTYVLHDYNFRLLTHISNSDQYLDKAPIFLAFTCGLLTGALTNLGVHCQVTGEVVTMPACTFQVKVVL